MEQHLNASKGKNAEAVSSGVAWRTRCPNVEINDGRAIARDFLDRTARECAKVIALHGITPGLAAVLFGNDPASEIYDEIGRTRAHTPVTGGVGPMTITCLILNTVRAAELALAETPLDSNGRIHASSRAGAISPPDPMSPALCGAGQ